MEAKSQLTNRQNSARRDEKSSTNETSRVSARKFDSARESSRKDEPQT